MGAHDALQFVFADQGRAPALRQPLMALGFRPMAVDLRRRQMARACELLDSASRPSVAEVAQRVGFMSANVFRRAFQKSFGIPPQAYRRKGD
jgi:AraC-like DNA-binding protein